jgi:phospholipid/cholesterol/gamma-HCH transport system ATP-binding protein
MTTERPQPIIRLVEVHKRFGDLVVLDGVSMDIPRGRTTTLLGASGTGKSVLLKHIVGLLSPDRGEVWVGDVDMATASSADKLAVRKRFGMLFQHGALFDNLSAGDNVAFPLIYHSKLSAAERKEVALEKLRLVELEAFYDAPTSALSGGQRKRVGLARAIVMEPEVVLFDEPNSGLDPLTSATIDDLIRRMQRQLGITFVIITHDIVQALAVSDHIGFLHQGHLLEYAPTDAFVATRHRVVRSFMERYVDLPDLDEATLLDP